MAAIHTSIILTPKESAGSTTTFFPNETAAGGAGIVWTSVAKRRRSPWTKPAQAGYDGIDAMFMGAKPVEFEIKGYVVEATEAAMRTTSETILALNRVQERWTLVGQIQNAGSGGVIVDDVVFEHLGEGVTKWRFTVILSDLEG